MVPKLFRGVRLNFLKENLGGLNETRKASKKN